MKIQVLIIYHTVYGDAVILMNYQSLSTRWWAQVKTSTVQLGREYQIQIRKTVPIWFMNIYNWTGINIWSSSLDLSIIAGRWGIILNISDNRNSWIVTA